MYQLSLILARSLTTHTLTNLHFAHLAGGFSQSSLFAQGHTISYFAGQILSKPVGISQLAFWDYQN